MNNNEGKAHPRPDRKGTSFALMASFQRGAAKKGNSPYFDGWGFENVLGGVVGGDGWWGSVSTGTVRQASHVLVMVALSLVSRRKSSLLLLLPLISACVLQGIFILLCSMES